MPAMLWFMFAANRKPDMPRHQFVECETCVNKEFDPFRCSTCRNGSNYEGESCCDEGDGDIDAQTLSEIIDLLKDTV